jgi:benzoyl-CoA reductase subunit C
MVVATKKGLERVQELYQDRPQRVKELKEQGKKIMGYLCIYPVLEMMTALDFVPYRVFGDMRETITRADSYMPPVVCPFLRSCLDIGLKGRYDFLDGMVTSHICDVGSSLSGVWNYTVKTPYHYHIDTPHTVHQTSLEQLRGLLGAFRKSLEEYTGKKITDAALKRAILLHNEQRTLVRSLYEQKKLDPPKISGSETIKVIKAIQSLPVEEGNALLRDVIGEIKTRKNGPTKKSTRLLVWGSVLDDTALVDMIESLDAVVAMDDTCVGSRPFFNDVELTADPIDGLARDFYATKKNYLEDLKSRFSYLTDYARDWNTGGVILESVRYCDTHGYEVPGVRDYLKSAGIPSIYLEHDYTEGALQPLKTRVQGFLELLA